MQGDEASIFDCDHNPLGTNNCEHKEDIGVICEFAPPPPRISSTAECSNRVLVAPAETTQRIGPELASVSSRAARPTVQDSVESQATGAAVVPPNCHLGDFLSNGGNASAAQEAARQAAYRSKVETRDQWTAAEQGIAAILLASIWGVLFREQLRELRKKLPRCACCACTCCNRKAAKRKASVRPAVFTQTTSQGSPDAPHRSMQGSPDVPQRSMQSGDSTRNLLSSQASSDAMPPAAAVESTPVQALTRLPADGSPAGVDASIVAAGADQTGGAATTITVVTPPLALAAVNMPGIKNDPVSLTARAKAARQRALDMLPLHAWWRIVGPQVAGMAILEVRGNV